MPAILLRAASILILLITAIAATHYGLELRREAWNYTYDCRFTGDISAGFRWGARAHNVGLFSFYDSLENGVFPDRRNDYPPLRLAVVTWWRNWSHARDPTVTAWENDYDLTRPMLRFNTLAEGSSALLCFAIIWTWRRRGLREEARWHTGLLAGTVGALAFWFNPAVIWDGHCWPQWDIWLVPFFLAAVLLASWNCWLLAGIALAIGASLKGQLLLAAPVMFLWPLFGLRFGALLRIGAGFLAGIAVIAFPFMQPGANAFRWYFMFLGALAVVAPVVLRWKLIRWWLIPPIVVAAALLAWPWQSSVELVWPWRVPAKFTIDWLRDFTIPWRCIPAVMIGLAAAARFLRPELKAAAYVLIIALSMLLLTPLFDASAAWYRVGFVHGTEKFDQMLSGTGSSNVPAMMRKYLQWPDRPDDPVQFPFNEEPITYTKATRIIYAICLLLCGIGAAIQDYRRDPRLLAALVAPWLIFFMLLTQMHGRYPIWAAGISALLFGVSTGLGLLGILVAIVGFIGIAHNQLAFRSSWWPEIYQMMLDLHPHLGWILLLASLIYLYHAVIPSRRSGALPHR